MNFLGHREYVWLFFKKFETMQFCFLKSSYSFFSSDQLYKNSRTCTIWKHVPAISEIKTTSVWKLHKTWRSRKAKWRAKITLTLCNFLALKGQVIWFFIKNMYIHTLKKVNEITLLIRNVFVACLCQQLKVTSSN